MGHSLLFISTMSQMFAFQNIILPTIFLFINYAENFYQQQILIYWLFGFVSVKHVLLVLL